MEIGRCWFRKLKELGEQVPTLESECSNLTLVGEYVGNQEHQHMVLYNRETFIFYAVVDNSSPEICWPIDRALALLKRFTLDIVSVESLGIYNTFHGLCDGLTKAFRDVAKGKIVEEEEGSVVYLT